MRKEEGERGYMHDDATTEQVYDHAYHDDEKTENTGGNGIHNAETHAQSPTALGQRLAVPMMMVFAQSVVVYMV